MTDAPAPTAPHTLDADFEKKLIKATTGPMGIRGLDDAGVKAIMTIAQASPDHADDMLKNITAYADERIKAFGGPASKETEQKLQKSFTDAAIDASVRSQGKDEPVVQALVKLSSYGTPMTADKIRTDLHTAATDAKAAAAAHASAEVDTSTGDPVADAAARAKKKKEADEAAEKQQHSQEQLGGDFITGLLKMLVTGLLGMFGVKNPEKVADSIFGMFSGGEKAPADTAPPAPAVTPADTAKAEAEGKSSIQVTDATGKKGVITAETIDNFLKTNGVNVPDADNKTAGMWQVVDQLRQANGLSARAGQHDINADDVKMLDKVQADHAGKQTAATGTAPATADKPAQHASLNVAEVTQMFTDLTGVKGDLGAAVKEYRKSHHIGAESSTTVDAAVLTAAIGDITQKNGWKVPELAAHLDTEVKAQATPVKVDAPVVTAQR